MKKIVLATLFSGCTLLSGCHSPDAPLNANFGEAVKRNMAMHIINPEGQHVTEIPGNDGERGQRAHDRMVKEKSTQPTMQLPAFVIQQPSK
jgi:hypothetical protein